MKHTLLFAMLLVSLTSGIAFADAFSDLDKDFANDGFNKGDSQEQAGSKNSAPEKSKGSSARVKKDVSVDLAACLFFPNDMGRVRCNLRVTNNGKERNFELQKNSSSMTDNIGNKFASG